jgi:hypothetical protein
LLDRDAQADGTKQVSFAAGELKIRESTCLNQQSAASNANSPASASPPPAEKPPVECRHRTTGARTLAGRVDRGRRQSAERLDRVLVVAGQK